MNINVYRERSQAILAGENEHGEKMVDVDVTQLTKSQREALARLGRDDSLSVTHYTESAVIAALDAENVKYERKIAEYLAMDIDKFDSETIYYDFNKYRHDPRLRVRLDGKEQRAAERKQKKYDDDINYLLTFTPEEIAIRWGNEYDYKLSRVYVDEPRLTTLRSEAQKILDQRKVAKLNAEAAEVARQKAIDDFRSAFVHEHMGTNAQERFAAGLLSADEINEAIEEITFAPLANFSLYEKLTTSDFRCEHDYDDIDVTFKVFDKPDATPDEWERLKKLRDIVEPLGGMATLQLHRADCGYRDHDYVYRTSIKITMPAGQLQFKRQYAC